MRKGNETLFPRVGGKNGTIGYAIANCLYRDGISIYAEPFGGSFGVARQAAPYPFEIWNDNDETLYALMKAYCANGNEVLERLLDTAGYSQSNFDYARLICECGEALEQEIGKHRSADASPYKIADDIQKAVYAWEILTQSFNGNAKQWAGIKKGNEKLAYMNMMAKKGILWERYKNVLPLNMDAFELIGELKDYDDVMLYIDSPYAFPDENQPKDMTKRTTKNLYPHDMENPDQKTLAELVLHSTAKLMLSGYRNSIYADILEASEGWYSYDIMEVCKASAVCMKGQKKPMAVETVWTNYPLGKLE